MCHVNTAIEARRLADLLKMLRTRRPMGSPTETRFRLEWIWSLDREVWQDDADNLHVVVPRTDGTRSRVLWSCHTDTVHREDGKQIVHLGPRHITLGDNTRPTNCLGADDTVGVWLCREMILAGVPGHYVFHYGEERGGIGSGTIAAMAPELYEGLDFAIALDRGGKRDVITHQAGSRGCSDLFARSLAKQLRSAGKYRPCTTGIYTDTAEYADIIPECTNISVGYERQHSPHEFVDYWHALRLCETLTGFDETTLVVSRQAGDYESTWPMRGYGLPIGDGPPSREEFRDAPSWSQRPLNDDGFPPWNDEWDDYYWRKSIQDVMDEQRRLD